jgi:hypothetical protein
VQVPENLRRTLRFPLGIQVEAELVYSDAYLQLLEEGMSQQQIVEAEAAATKIANVFRERHDRVSKPTIVH